MPPRRSPFLSPLSPNDPLVYALPPIDPIFCHSKTPKFWFVTQRPPILILSVKTHHFNLLAQTVISHNNWSQDFNGFIARGQLDVINISVNLWFERPIQMIFGLSPKDFLFSGCSHRKTHVPKRRVGKGEGGWRCYDVYRCSSNVLMGHDTMYIYFHKIS